MYDSTDPADDIAVNRTIGCRRIHIGPRHLARAETIDYYFGGPFRLRDNLAMSADEHRRIVALLGLVQRAVDESGPFIEAEGLPRDVFDPQNQWTIMLQDGGINRSIYLPFRQPGEASVGSTMRPRDAYNNLNWTRILSPFSGYYLAYLDRLDQGGLFPQPYPHDVLDRIWSDVLPDDLPDIMESHLDHHQRLAHVPEQHFLAIRNMPSDLVVGALPRGGEVGLMIDGRVVNPDTLRVQGRINAMYSGGLIGLLREKAERTGQRIRVLEIGPGHGGLARALSGIFRDRVEYMMVDLPPMIHYAAVYLSLAGIDVDVAVSGRPPDNGASHWLVPNYLLPHLADDLPTFDLVINTMSMNEMSAAQVHHYAALIRRLLASDGVFYEENAVGLGGHVDCRAEFQKLFPFRRHIRSFHVAAGLGQPFVWSVNYIPRIFDRWDWSLP